jgi:ubiquinone/menaquinone biosynthesis C-methylase UbiE
MIHEYHRRQYDQCYEATRCLFEFIDGTVVDVGTRKILDAACGAGANVHHMLQRWRESNVTGLDRDETLLDYARARVLPQNASRCEYVRADFFDLPTLYEPDRFGITTLMQTLQFFAPDEYAEVLRALMKVTRDWVFVSSLFTNKRMDVIAGIRDYTRFPEDSFAQDSEQLTFYNTFCMDRFRRVAEQLGAQEVIFRDFEIGIDLVGPAAGGIGTYTETLADGRRLQFSGAVFMPWKFAALRLR